MTFDQLRDIMMCNDYLGFSTNSPERQTECDCMEDEINRQRTRKFSVQKMAEQFNNLMEYNEVDETSNKADSGLSKILSHNSL